MPGIFHEALERFASRATGLGAPPTSAIACAPMPWARRGRGSSACGSTATASRRPDDEAAEASAAGVVEIRGLDELVAQLVPRLR